MCRIIAFLAYWVERSLAIGEILLLFSLLRFIQHQSMAQILLQGPECKIGSYLYLFTLQKKLIHSNFALFVSPCLKTLIGLLLLKWFKRSYRSRALNAGKNEIKLWCNGFLLPLVTQSYLFLTLNTIQHITLNTYFFFSRFIHFQSKLALEEGRPAGS